MKMVPLFVACSMYAFSQIAVAADLRVDKAAWESLSVEERGSIERNLIEHRVMLAGDKIVGVDGAGGAGAWNPACDLKRAACDVAAAAAVAGCSGTAAAIAVCIALAMAGRDKCREC